MVFLLKDRLVKFFIVIGLTASLCLFIGFGRLFVSVFFGVSVNGFEFFWLLFKVFASIFLIVDYLVFFRVFLIALYLKLDRGSSILKVMVGITQFGMYKKYAEINSELLSEGEF